MPCPNDHRQCAATRRRASCHDYFPVANRTDYLRDSLVHYWRRHCYRQNNNLPMRKPLLAELKATRCLLAALALSIGSHSAIAQKTPLPHPVNLNTATIAQLETLPGVGPNTAKSIVDFRNRSGPFQRVEDLLAVKGISKSKLEKLRPYVTVGPAAPNRYSDSSHHASVALGFSSPNFQKAM